MTPDDLWLKDKALTAPAWSNELYRNERTAGESKWGFNEPVKLIHINLHIKTPLWPLKMLWPFSLTLQSTKRPLAHSIPKSRISQRPFHIQSLLLVMLRRNARIAALTLFQRFFDLVHEARINIDFTAPPCNIFTEHFFWLCSTLWKQLRLKSFGNNIREGSPNFTSNSDL